MASQTPEASVEAGGSAELGSDAAASDSRRRPSTGASAEPTEDDAHGDHGACPVIESLDQIGSKWRLAVLHELLDGELRFNELKRATGANARTLSRVLDDLGETGFVDRRLEEASPVATYYSLTSKGESLDGVFAEIECWAGQWLDADGYEE